MGFWSMRRSSIAKDRSFLITQEVISSTLAFTSCAEPSRERCSSYRPVLTTRDEHTTWWAKRENPLPL